MRSIRSPRAFLACIATLASALASAEVVFPADAPVWNVRAYGAVGDGQQDDTAAFKAAISAALSGPSRYSAIRIIYVPDGTYKLTDTLQNRVLPDGAWDGFDRWRAGFHLQGQSRAGTVLRLADNSPGFADPTSPKPVLQTGSERPNLVAAPRLASLTRSDTVATATYTNHRLATGMQVLISGATQSAYNGPRTVTVLDANTFTFPVSGMPSSPATGTPRFNRLGSSLTRSRGTATLTYPGHGFKVGDQVVVSGADQSAYNGGKYITSVTADSFRFSVSGSPVTPATGVITIARFSEGGYNEAFRHYIRDLTVDVGAGNPGAVGIDYLGNNRGGVYDVAIRSSDPARAGHTGLRMDREWPGPALIKNVSVTGFDTGVSLLNHGQYGMAFEHLTLAHQRSLGIAVFTNTLTIRGLLSQNSVPVLDATNSRAHVTLLDADLSGGSPARAAITTFGKTYLRDLRSEGYGTVVQDRATHNRDVAGGPGVTHVDEYANFDTLTLHDSSIDGSVRLPVAETPEARDVYLSRWRSVSTTTESAAGATPFVDTDDDLPGIQAAIDSGADIVYLPQGNYSVSNTIELRGSVRKLIGLCAGISRRSGFPAGAPLVRFTGAEGAEFSVVQHLRLGGDIEHDSPRTLVVANSDYEKYGNTVHGTGRLFVEDVIAQTLTVRHPQRVWARQLNLETHNTVFDGSYVTNHGGRVWILGYKTEGNRNARPLATHGGWVELFGGFFYPNNDSVTEHPMLLNEEGQFSANYKVNDLETTNFTTHVTETREGATESLPASGVPDDRNCALYSGATQIYPRITADTLLAYALGLPLDARDTADRVVLRRESLDGSEHLALFIRQRADDPALRFAVETSSDLAIWIADGVARPGALEHGDGTRTIVYEDPLPLGATPRRFLRLRVTLD